MVVIVASVLAACYISYYPFGWGEQVGPRYQPMQLQTLLRMQLARQRAPLEHESEQRWVVAKSDRGMGLCNRMMNSVSCLAFAIVTGRRLWIDWDALPVSRINEKEVVGVDSYDSLFSSELRGSPPSDDLLRKAVFISNYGFYSFLRPLALARDLNEAFPFQVVAIQRCDFWGALVLANVLDERHGFSVLFRALFTPKNSTAEPEPCTWLLQRRVVWNRFTPPPVSQYIECARAHGLTTADSASTWLLTDDNMAHQDLPDGVRLVEPNASLTRGEGGDRASVESMYRMSECKNAVLTATSTFGACVAGLAGASAQYEMLEDGSCRTLRFTEPIDNGVLPTESRDITMLIDQIDTRRSR